MSLLSDEVNVRTVELTELADHDDRVSRQLSVNARAAGPRLGKDVQKVIKASKAGDWSVGDDGAVVCGGFALVEGEYTLELVGGRRRRRTRSVCCGPAGSSRWTPCWTTTWSPTAWSATCPAGAGPARAPGLEVSDRIELTVVTDDQVARAAMAGRWPWFAEQVLALNEASVGEGATGEGWGAADLVVGTGVNAKVRAHIRKA